METALDMPRLLDLLDAGQMVLLPTDRAAQILRERFDRRQAARGMRAWEPAIATTWREWTSSLWSTVTLHGHDDRVLLNRLQEEALWGETIRNTAQGSVDRDALDEMAALASSALNLAAAHLPFDDLPSRLLSSADTFDARTFAGWCSSFLAHCESERLLPGALLDHALQQHVREHRIALPATLHLAGFDRLTPSQQALLSGLETSGVQVHPHTIRHPAARQGVRTSVHAGSPQDELRSAVRWIRARCSDPDPDPSIALILPSPENERAALEPLLREILAPELERIDADLSSTPWRFSKGSQLAHLPVVQHALLLLRWTNADLPLEEIGRVLFSPFFAHSDDLESRARFEIKKLRAKEILRPELSLPDLLALARGDSPGQPSFRELHAVVRLLGAPGELSGNGAFADWTELVRKILRSAGWPGTRTLSPAEFRATEAWEGLLDRIATLDLHGRRVHLSGFLRLLQREARSSTVPEPAGSATVQIASLQEVEGCLFDATLILRATDQVLPPAERAHPFLGWALQHKLRLPGTDIAATHARSRDDLRSLLDRSGDLLLFAAAEDESGPVRLTPLVPELGIVQQSADSILPPEPSRPPITTINVEETEQLPPLPQPHVPGGARVLELQAACGFRAFASLRLRAQAPESRGLGLDARESGNLVHRAMELLWSDLKTQEHLRNLSPEDRRRAVERAVTTAFDRLRTRFEDPDPWTGNYLEILQQRLINLILRWIPFELERADFRVLPPEQEQTVSAGPLELSVRLDRIDAVDEGYVFIDYKTGFDLSTRDWLGDRPDAPQLPLYTCLAEADEVRGVAFARMRPGKDMAWIRLQDRLGPFPPKTNETAHDLAAEIAHWRAEIDRLACAFAEGRAEVDPKSYPKTCQHCEMRLLCRVNPSALNRDAEIADESEAHGG